jgi:hypothetical protein
MLRYFEAYGEVRQAISIVKKRGGAHERTIREFKLDSGRIRVGETLRSFRGVLTGVPVYEGDAQPLLGEAPPRRSGATGSSRGPTRSGSARGAPAASTGRKPRRK